MPTSLSEWGKQIARFSGKILASLRAAGDVPATEQSLKALVTDAVTFDQFTKGRNWEIFAEQLATYREYLLNQLGEDIERGKLTNEQIVQRSAMIVGMGRMFVGFRKFLEAGEQASKTLTARSGITAQRKEDLHAQLHLRG